MNEFQNATYLGVFLDEMEEQLQCLDDALLILESDSGKEETIQTIFRAAHTLKGSSAVMGFQRLNELTHQMESVFDLIRNGQLEVTSELLNILFDCVDYIKHLRQSILGGEMTEGETAPLLKRLEAVRDLTGTLPECCPQEVKAEENKEISTAYIILNEMQKEQIQGAIVNGSDVMAIYVQLSKEAAMKYVRAKLVHINLQELGEVVVCSPELELIETDEQFNGTIVYILITQEIQKVVLHSLSQVSQIESVNIVAITDQNLDVISVTKEADRIETATKAEMEVTEIVRSESKIEGKAESKVQVTQTVRVDIERLEGLLNLVGELIIDNTRLCSIRAKLTEQFKDNSDVANLNDISNHLSNVVADLQEGMMKTRMLPIEHLFGRFPRMVRDLAQKANKEIELIIEGKETELDRTLIEEISDPLIHILRNSADHGLELPNERVQLGKSRKGNIILRASHQGNMIVITIADDGRGIDIEKVKEMSVRKGFVTEEEVNQMTDKELIFLIFRSGVSTANQVTDVSGRGVGMDIVKSHIEKLNGVIDIETVPNEGTVFTIKLPLTLAIIRSLLVKFGTSTFAIPLVNVIEIFRLQVADIRLVQGKEVCMFRDQVLPLVRLHDKLHVQEDVEQNRDRLFVVIVGVADKRVCLIVDQTIGNHEIVIKPLGSYIGNVPYIAGSTILGDGHVAHILDVGSIAREVGSYYEKKVLDAREEAQLESRNKKYVTFQLADVKFGIAISKMKEIVPVPEIHSLVSATPHVLGMINLRGLLLPVYDLRRRLGMENVETSSKSRILICEVSGHEVGLMVDEVTEVSRLSEADLEEAPDHVLRNSDFLEAIYKKNQQFILLLNLEKMLNLEYSKKKEAG